MSDVLILFTAALLRASECFTNELRMQWSTEAHGGFTRARKPILPVISDGLYGFEKLNAADQRRDPRSLLNWTERIIRMRKEVPERGWGAFHVLIIHNLRDEALQVKLSLDRDRGKKLVNLLTGDHSEADGRGRHRIAMEPYGYHWYRMGGLGYLLDRTNV